MGLKERIPMSARTALKNEYERKLSVVNEAIYGHEEAIKLNKSKLASLLSERRRLEYEMAVRWGTDSVRISNHSLEVLPEV